MAERLIAGLHDEQLHAQERVQSAKQTGAAPNSFDRDTASWLAAGLADLLDDAATGESFLRSGKGKIALLASGELDVRFAENDFLRPDGIKFLEASRQAQTMLTKLSLASTNQYRLAVRTCLMASSIVWLCRRPSRLNSMKRFCWSTSRR